MARAPNASAFGNLMYAMVGTCLYVSHKVSTVCRLMANTRKTHQEAVEWVLRYLKGILDTGLCFSGYTCQVVKCAESNYASDLDKRQSTIGCVFQIHGAPVSQRALSTTEAVFMMVVAEAVKEASWLQGLLDDLGLSGTVLTCGVIAKM